VDTYQHMGTFYGLQNKLILKDAQGESLFSVWYSLCAELPLNPR
jgi:uncharacterized protein YxjI